MSNQMNAVLFLGLLLSTQPVYAAEQCLKYPKTVSFQASDSIFDAQVSPSGKELYVVLPTKLQVVDLETGAVTKEIPLKDLVAARLSATGLLAVNERDNTAIIDIQTGEKKVVDLKHTSYGYIFSSDGRYLLHDFGNDYLIYDTSTGKMVDKVSGVVKSSSWSFSFGGRTFGNSSGASPEQKLQAYGIYYSKFDLLKNSPTIAASDGKLLVANADKDNGVVRLLDAGSSSKYELVRVLAPDIKQDSDGPFLSLRRINLSKDGEYIVVSVERRDEQRRTNDEIVNLYPTPPPCPTPEAAAPMQEPAPQEATPVPEKPASSDQSVSAASDSNANSAQ